MDVGDIAIDDIMVNDTCSDDVDCPILQSELIKSNCSVADEYSSGTHCAFECDSQHYLKGATTIACLPSGTWDNKQPVCIENGMAKTGIRKNNTVHIIEFYYQFLVFVSIL
ncbi:predicted protein [Nematostella vectensis]|uniref:Sushi domain-containing protein n=1 Tax=Nematostella vectensis TaxID=45351 RepID=A7SL48_NEMVE|nr:predicted protein [Nematostella vectensis]|eukprot:XP_001627696.1 predicted protein [Nematostella vectensis]